MNLFCHVSARGADFQGGLVPLHRFLHLLSFSKAFLVFAIFSFCRPPSPHNSSGWIIRLQNWVPGGCLILFILLCTGGDGRWCRVCLNPHTSVSTGLAKHFFVFFRAHLTKPLYIDGHPKGFAFLRSSVVGQNPFQKPRLPNELQRFQPLNYVAIKSFARFRGKNSGSGFRLVVWGPMGHCLDRNGTRRHPSAPPPFPPRGAGELDGLLPADQLGHRGEQRLPQVAQGVPVDGGRRGGAPSVDERPPWHRVDPGRAQAIPREARRCSVIVCCVFPGFPPAFWHPPAAPNKVGRVTMWGAWPRVFET